MDEAELIGLADALVREAGRGGARSLDRLAGGRNNRVFRVETEAGEPVVLKLYHHDPRDPRNRLEREWAFLSYAWSRGERCVPEPLMSSPAAHAGLYGFAPGRKLATEEITAGKVEEAMAFVRRINASPRGFDRLPEGSEACFTLAGHLSTVDGRVARLSQLAPDAPGRDAAAAFVAHELAPRWRSVKAAVARGAARLGVTLDRQLPAETICLSPSDFGFHNALADGARLVFIDFEHAGRDDPAKLVCDFFCQPETPVPAALFEPVLQHLAHGLMLGPVEEERCRLLLDAYRIKWCCIILNDFLPVGQARRAFADIERTEALCRAQLARAEHSLAQITV